MRKNNFPPYAQRSLKPFIDRQGLLLSHGFPAQVFGFPHGSLWQVFQKWQSGLLTAGSASWHTSHPQTSPGLGNSLQAILSAIDPLLEKGIYSRNQVFEYYHNFFWGRVL